MIENFIQQCVYKIMKIACIANCLALSPVKFLPPRTLTLARIPCVTVVSGLCGGRQHNLDFYGTWRIYDSGYRHTVYPETESNISGCYKTLSNPMCYGGL